MVRLDMQIVISGASGLIGQAVTRGLRGKGHNVLTLVRRPPGSVSERHWDPTAGVLDATALEGADAVINLSGAGIGDRLWTRARIRELSASRVLSTQTLVKGMKQLGSPPSVFISQSASGFYGDAGATILNEESPAGSGVLARLCLEWEAAANEAPPGVRVITPRTGVVLSPAGGALGKLLPLVQLGLGGPLGNGRQYWPWVTLPDVVSAFSFFLHAPLAGPANLAAPHSAQLNSLISHLASALNRPALLKGSGARPAPRHGQAGG
ncbi:TIGR01777 family oxidoreductase [Arthrobacter sp. SA17]